MSKQNTKNFKNSRVITVIASFLLVGILTALLTVNLTMAAFGTIQIAGKEYIFGNIILDDVSNDFTIKNSLDELMTKVSPGDVANVEFSLQNVGLAAMFVRFKLVIEDRATENKVDTSIFSMNLESSNYFDGLAMQDVEYVLYDFDGHNGAVPTGTPDLWYVRRNYIIGAVPPVPSQEPDNIKMTIQFPGEEMDNSYKGAQLDFFLYVKAVQFANNGTQKDVTLPGYDLIWSE